MAPVAAIVLAAGASRRLGMPKQLVRVGNETLLERAVRTALEAGLTPVLGVIPQELSVDPPEGMLPVVNLQASEGMASSIRAGLRSLTAERRDVSGAVLLACDQPAVTSDHLRELARGGPNAVASAYAGRKGIPAYFPSAAFSALMGLNGDAGARELLRDARAVPLVLGELDVDTAEDLDRVRKLYGS